MTAQKLTLSLVASLMLLVGTTPASGQEPYIDGALTSSDMQWFAPVGLDFDDRPIRNEAGFSFGYEKVYWAASGERHTIGAEGATSTASMNPYRVFVQGSTVIPDPMDPDGDPIVVPGTIINIAPPTYASSINSAPPRNEFGWGERYEFGYSDGEDGWLVGVLDGPAIVDFEGFGFGFTGQDDTTTAVVGLPSPFPAGPNQLISPLGSVMVVFDYDPGFMDGFLDVVDGLFVGGVPGGSLEADGNGDGILDGDGFADDINVNGQYGPDGFDLMTPGLVPDTIVVGEPPDFDDLVELPTSFQTLTVRNQFTMSGIEIMRVHKLNNRHHMAQKQNNEVELYYGVRYLRANDQFDVQGTGGVLGTSFWNTQSENNIVGPQFALRYKHQRRRLLVDWSGRCLLGVNIANLRQSAGIGEDLIPGQHNHPLYFNPTYSNHGIHQEEFSPVVEMRVQASYQLSSNIALKLGYTANFIDNLRRSSQQVRYHLPDMGFRDGGTDDVFVNGLNMGFEVVH